MRSSARNGQPRPRERLHDGPAPRRRGLELARGPDRRRHDVVESVTLGSRVRARRSPGPARVEHRGGCAGSGATWSPTTTWRLNASLQLAPGLREASMVDRRAHREPRDAAPQRAPLLFTGSAGAARENLDASWTRSSSRPAGRRLGRLVSQRPPARGVLPFENIVGLVQVGGAAPPSPEEPRSSHHEQKHGDRSRQDAGRRRMRLGRAPASAGGVWGAVPEASRPFR